MDAVNRERMIDKPFDILRCDRYNEVLRRYDDMESTEQSDLNKSFSATDLMGNDDQRWCKGP